MKLDFEPISINREEINMILNKSPGNARHNMAVKNGTKY